MRQASPGTADVCAARRYPIGAESRGDGVAFRVWAPKRKRVAILIDGGGEHELRREPGGYFSATVPEARPGARYRFRLDNDRTLYPDPASRLQPDGPHGASQVIDPRAYAWQDDDWRGVKLAGQVIYELHVGTFTPQGTWTGAMDKLPLLKELGITLIEMMPVNEFPGRFGWGYDGVNLFAPTRLYGSPDDLRRFVDAAHRLGMGVILDVVYNHLGPATSPTDTRTSGARRSISTATAPSRCATSSPRTRPIGSRSSISTDCGSMQPRACTTPPTST
jgi:maltooligosyltrehalose trehalohydrolase